MLARNPIALELQEISKGKISLAEMFKRYEGFKDGEFLALLSSIFGLSLSEGEATCYSGVGRTLSDLLTSLQSTLDRRTNREALSTYLGVQQLPSAKMFYWKYHLQKFSASQRALLQALLSMDAIGYGKAKTKEEIASAVAEAGASFSEDDLDMLRVFKTVDTYREGYCIVDSEAEALQSALATL
jgi:hypothetical protein